MILNLNEESDFIKHGKNLEKLTNTNTVLFNKANWCGHCQVFAPQWEEFKKNMASKINIVEIESSILNIIKNQNNKLFKRLTPSNGAMFFPMLIIFTKKDKKIEKKLYEGNRDSTSLQKFVENKIKTSKKPTKVTKTEPAKVQKPKPVKKEIKKENKKGGETNQHLTLFEINKELENILNELNFRQY